MYGGTFLAANQGTSIAELLALRCLRGSQGQRELDRQNCSSANITNKLYYDALYQSATPFVFVAPGRSVEHGAFGAVLIEARCRRHADLYSQRC